MITKYKNRSLDIKNGQVTKQPTQKIDDYYNSTTQTKGNSQSIFNGSTKKQQSLNQSKTTIERVSDQSKARDPSYLIHEEDANITVRTSLRNTPKKIEKNETPFRGKPKMNESNVTTITNQQITQKPQQSLSPQNKFQKAAFKVVMTDQDKQLITSINDLISQQPEQDTLFIQALQAFMNNFAYQNYSKSITPKRVQTVENSPMCQNMHSFHLEQPKRKTINVYERTMQSQTTKISPQRVNEQEAAISKRLSQNFSSLIKSQVQHTFKSRQESPCNGIIQNQQKSKKEIEKILNTTPQIKKEYGDLVYQMENNREQITSKILQRFISEKNPTDESIKLGISLIYLLISLDPTIPLTNDKSQLFDHSWELVVRCLSNQGRVLFNMKKLKDFVNNGHFKPGHIQKARRYVKDCGNDLPSSGRNILNYVLSTLKFIKFVQQCYKLDKCTSFTSSPGGRGMFNRPGSITPIENDGSESKQSNFPLFTPTQQKLAMLVQQQQQQQQQSLIPKGPKHEKQQKSEIYKINRSNQNRMLSIDRSRVSLRSKLNEFLTNKTTQNNTSTMNSQKSMITYKAQQ